MIGTISLRNVLADDLPIFFEQQLDVDANYVEAFTSTDPADRDAFLARWNRILGDESIIIQTILFDGQVAGFVLSFDESSRQEVSYWIGTHYWGKGIATRALSEFLVHIENRLLFARVAKDNLPSLRVLEKCGFVISGEDKGFANARGTVIEEYILTRL